LLQCRRLGKGDAVISVKDIGRTLALGDAIIGALVKQPKPVKVEAVCLLALCPRISVLTAAYVNCAKQLWHIPAAFIRVGVDYFNAKTAILTRVGPAGTTVRFYRECCSGS